MIKDFLIILFLVFVAYYFYKWYNEIKIKESFRNHVQKSNGIMDKNAIEAVNIYKSLNNPEKNDIVYINQLIELNDYQGRIDNKDDFNLVVENYTNILNDELDWWEIHQIENFVDRHQDILARQREFDFFVQNVENIPTKKIDKTITEIKNQESNKKDILNTFTEVNKTFTSDTQNVHDSSVNYQLKNGYYNLKKNTPIVKSTDKVIDDINNQIKNFSKNKQNNIRKAIDTLSNKNNIESLNGDNEKELLTIVWNRSLLPENKENSENIQNAIFNALEDIVLHNGESTSVVCTTGRCTRLFNSLTLLDHDNKISNGLCTTEQLRNDALDESNKILQDSIKYHKNDSIFSKVAESYETGDSTNVKEEDEKAFKAMNIEKIEQMLDLKYKAKFAEKDFIKIKKQCIDAILYL